VGEANRSLRCAIYTRKSTEEGLEQEFNTLQAQREAGEAYILSQSREGWLVLPQRYDDGGCSGASLDRPALQQLLVAIEAGQIDCVVVYKVDRLSRSLLDFTRLMSTFDRCGVSFVSVTQQFNTTTSIGRLTLNILLSFAQFERELIGERTRDKLSAARRKGKWIGGIPVLGYDIRSPGEGLVVQEEEAQTVREIFQIADASGTLAQTLEEVTTRGWKNKSWVTRAGRKRTGKLFCRSSLSALLRNVLYKGFVSHKGALYPGEQSPIVEPALWERVNAQLALQGASQRSTLHRKQQGLLDGLVRCGECGAAMARSHTQRHGRRHDYYVCRTGKARGCSQRPVCCADLEQSIAEQLAATLGTAPSAMRIQQAVERIGWTASTREVLIELRDGTRLNYFLPTPNRPGVRRNETAAEGRIPRVSRLLALAIKLEQMVREGVASSYANLAAAGQVSGARMSQIVALTNLAPAIQEQLLFLPHTISGVDRIVEKDLRAIAGVVDWQQQITLFRNLAEPGSRSQ
jgi:DNA invertase Pin-like site-specific DNA recombinase